MPGGYIIDDTLSTKFATELTAFFMVFWVLAELLFMVATVPATMAAHSHGHAQTLHHIYRFLFHIRPPLLNCNAPCSISLHRAGTKSPRSFCLCPHILTEKMAKNDPALIQCAGSFFIFQKFQFGWVGIFSTAWPSILSRQEANSIPNARPSTKISRSGWSTKRRSR